MFCPLWLSTVVRIQDFHVTRDCKGVSGQQCRLISPSFGGGG